MAAVIVFYLLFARRAGSPTHGSATGADRSPDSSAEPEAEIAAAGEESAAVHPREESVSEPPARPQPVAVANDRAAEPMSEPTSDSVFDKPLVLVAEDNPSNYKLVEVLLRNDYTLLHAVNGQEAVDLFAEHRPRLVLMDISMPVMDGYDALRGIRALDPAAHVIALTAYAFEADRQKMLQSGFNACLAKPLDVAELRRMIRGQLEKR